MDKDFRGMLLTFAFIIAIGAACGCFCSYLDYSERQNAIAKGYSQEISQGRVIWVKK